MGHLSRSRFDLWVTALHQCGDTLSTSSWVSKAAESLCSCYLYHYKQQLGCMVHVMRGSVYKLSCLGFTTIPVLWGVHNEIHVSSQWDTRALGSLAHSPQQAVVQMKWQLHAGSLTRFPCLDTEQCFAVGLSCPTRHSVTFLASVH